MNKKIFGLITVIFLLWPFASRAVVLKNSYPRLANYFLKWEITDIEAQELAKWDLLILDMDVQENSLSQLKKIRTLNPEIIILAYLTSQEMLDGIEYYYNGYLRQELAKNIIDDWWIKDQSGKKISNWPGTYMINLTDAAKTDYRGYRFNDYLPEFVFDYIKSSGLWDGIFYDNTWGEISWLNSGNYDFNTDGIRESASEADRLWIQGVSKMLNKTRSLVGNEFIIMGNGKVYQGYQPIMNGMMLENFPSDWESNGVWSGSMKTYWNLPKWNASPSLPVINVSDKNRFNYVHFRFGFASALLGDGFYGFDYDATDHGQTWWYDEYNINLGMPQSEAYNLLAGSSKEANPGLWRRDFKNGIVIVNSTSKKQTYVFDKEEFEKIKGSQDPAINNGKKVNYVQLAAGDGLVLLNVNNIISNASFTNGYFYRVFDLSGQQTRNGFFSYLKAYPGEAEVIIASGDNNGQAINISGASGRVDLNQNGKKLFSFDAYNQLYKKKLNLAAKIEDGYFRKIIVGTGEGGGPQVRVFSPSGKIESSFFAYDKNLRSGVNVAMGDIDGDGQDEIITGPGKGTSPLIKIFSLDGKLKHSFLAYDTNFLGGVSVAVGDINQDGCEEIVTGPLAGGGPHVRVFNSKGSPVSSFFAYDKSYRGGIRVSVGEVGGSDKTEILVGLKNFY
ncbi:MAG: putative glycoside hydrolase [Patescibacteria group bacterium]